MSVKPSEDLLRLQLCMGYRAGMSTWNDHSGNALHRGPPEDPVNVGCWWLEFIYWQYARLAYHVLLGT